MEQKSSSPVIIKKKKYMDFPSAVREVISGKKIHRDEWPAGEYGVMQDGFLMIVRDTGTHKWIISDGDTEAKDWFTI